MGIALRRLLPVELPLPGLRAGREGRARGGPQPAPRPPAAQGIPRRLPRGCNKGAAWSAQLDAPDRLLHPLRRVGPRGSGEWERVSWDEALDAVADGLIDAIETHGPRSILREGTPEMAATIACERLMGLLGGTSTDVNGALSDFAPGLHCTIGHSHVYQDEPSHFLADVVLVWHSNPVYTAIPFFHYLTEARYRGAEIVLVSPDVSPSHVHADLHVPVRPGSDPALALAMARVIVEEGLVDEEFVRTQTDLALLARRDTGRFLRASDLDPAGRDDQFFHLDEHGAVVEADRGSLLPDGYVPALAGEASVTLADGTVVVVGPVMARLVEHLAAYRPEAVRDTTGVHPDTVRTLARKVAGGRTRLWMGMGANKAYHSDLYQRTMLLVLALTGNWGRPGAGFTHWANAQIDGWMIASAKARPGPEGAEEILAGLEGFGEILAAGDPTMTPEITAFEVMRATVKAPRPGMVPPAFLWYWHAGFRDLWNAPVNADPSMGRPFDEYVAEAVDRGWWSTVVPLGPDTPPRVLVECGGNIVRRTRGGRNTLLSHLWPELELVVTVDVRMSATALWSDIVLPAAQHYEKVSLQMPTYYLTMTDEAVPPAGESKPEWEIFRDLCRALARRAAARGVESFRHPDGREVRYADLEDRYTLGGAWRTDEQVYDEIVRDSAHSGILPPGSDLATMRETGQMRFTEWGRGFMAVSHAAPWTPEDEIANPLEHHVQRGDPYPTLTRRAQFLIDHPWFVEAGEDLPVHKDMPTMGGDHPFLVLGGHNRWSVHACNMGNPLLLQTHRGEPHLVVNPEDASRLGIADHDRVRVSNDVGSFVVRAKTSPGQRPGVVTVYNGWDPHMFEEWGGANDVSPGMVKHLGFVGGYGHLDYAPIGWQPIPADRGVRVALAPVPAD
ncbi:MAG: molybdopterin-dependent oxidoreductase [Acidimicrobiia bacterium]|nr:molybdopterin-dependent oxidoreductase [Acidimicrobiia bacterium]